MQDFNDSKRLKLPEIDPDKNKYKFVDETKNHIEEMKHGSNNILVKNKKILKKNTYFKQKKVAVRMRPLNSKELTVSDFETVRILDNKLVILLDPGNEFEPEDVLLIKQIINKNY